LRALLRSYVTADMAPGKLAGVTLRRLGQRNRGCRISNSMHSGCRDHQGAAAIEAPQQGIMSLVPLQRGRSK